MTIGGQSIKLLISDTNYFSRDLVALPLDAVTFCSRICMEFTKSGGILFQPAWNAIFNGLVLEF